MPCTTILVGKNASYDGSTLVARNEDSSNGVFEPKRMRVEMCIRDRYVPEQGIPCEISPQQARANALQLVRQYPDAFAGHDVEDAIQNDMMLFYFPMALADLRMMASFPGKGLSKEALVYYEVLDWARCV